MFVANRQRTRYVDAGATPVAYYRDFLDEVRDRGDRVDQAFSACRLALRCQLQAERIAR